MDKEWAVSSHMQHLIIKIASSFSILIQAFVFDEDFSDVLPSSSCLIFTIVIIFLFSMRFFRCLKNGLTAQLLQGFSKKGFSKISDEVSVYTFAQLMCITIVSMLLTFFRTIEIKMSALLAFCAAGVSSG